MKKILIVNGHPDKKSFCAAQVRALQKGAETQKHKVTVLNAYDFDFIQNHPGKIGFPDGFEDLANEISSFDVFVFCSPLWNFGMPAGLKNFLDGAFQPKKSFQFQGSKFLQFLGRISFLRRRIPGGIPKGLLQAQKAICLVSADAPSWYYRLFPCKNLVFQQIKHFLAFCGVKKCKGLFFGGIRNSTKKERKSWLLALEKTSF